MRIYCHNFFFFGFVSLKSLSRGIYLNKSLKRGIYTDKFPIAHIRYIKILTWLRGFLVLLCFGLVFFVLESLLAIARQWSRKKLAILALKPWGHVRILIYRTWAINSYEFNSSDPLFPAALSSPPRTFSLLNIQEGCTLNKGCLITKEKVLIMK